MNDSGPVSKKALRAGYIMTAPSVLLLIFSAIMKLAKPVSVVDGMAHFGISENLLLPLGIVELACTAIYLIPSTAVLGAILLTGYLGGATCACLRVGEPFIPAVLVGVFVWGGLFLRDPRVRALIPLRRAEART